VTKRKWSDVEEGRRNIERGVFDDSALDAMPVGDREERLPAARRPKVRRSRIRVATRSRPPTSPSGRLARPFGPGADGGG
jgi:hypothetical protein